MSDSSNFMPHGDLLKQLGQAHTGAVTQWDKMKEGQAALKNTREQLDKLVALGDMVTGDDVLDAATELVASGQSAATLAGLLADMPQDGPSLQQWILSQDQRVEQQEQAVEQGAKLAQHQVAVTAAQLLHGYGTLGEPPAESGPRPATSVAASPPSNPLSAAPPQGVA